MARFARGTYAPANPEKYTGKRLPVYRSSWERLFMQFCDNHPSVIQWASESVQIPYLHPLTGKTTRYIPDFVIVYQDKHGNRKAELIEIKPSSQTLKEAAGRSLNNHAAIAVNMAKWKAAAAWCQKMGLTFRVLNEGDLFRK
jgi:hypothetical protein